ncbi:hypothetical protein NDU88_003567 [Pleurodeles waltl]|uniref:Uncharacterized protein n=1 Tax=Pleurodeles waltl TaxID=8319 RepID=A0AAV7W603_PLEWA|nr:hypothetical protein NDU88_003567 [Pleurodeles waltl]
MDMPPYQCLEMQPEQPLQTQQSLFVRATVLFQLAGMFEEHVWHLEQINVRLSVTMRRTPHLAVAVRERCIRLQQLENAASGCGSHGPPHAAAAARDRRIRQLGTAASGSSGPPHPAAAARDRCIRLQQLGTAASGCSSQGLPHPAAAVRDRCIRLQQLGTAASGCSS